MGLEKCSVNPVFNQCCQSFCFKGHVMPSHGDSSKLSAKIFRVWQSWNVMPTCHDPCGDNLWQRLGQSLWEAPSTKKVATSRVRPKEQGPAVCGFQVGGIPDLDLSFLFGPFLSFLSFLGLSRFLSGFPRFLPGFSWFNLVLFPLSRPISSIKSAYEEQSRKGPRHNPGLKNNCARIGRKLRGSFYRGSFHKGVWVPIGVPGFRWVVGGGLLLGNEENGEGGGEVGWGRDQQRNRQVNAQAFVKTTL